MNTAVLNAVKGGGGAYIEAPQRDRRVWRRRTEGAGQGRGENNDFSYGGGGGSASILMADIYRDGSARAAERKKDSKSDARTNGPHTHAARRRGAHEARDSR